MDDFSQGLQILPPGGWAVVLDTHVVLDWLWFEDPRVQPVAQAVRAGHLRWLATPPMRAELEDVLDRFQSKKTVQNKERVLTLVDQYAHWIHEPIPPWPHRCTDPDDQMFLDLAAHRGARWLLSRDKAVLKLKSSARATGCEITTPEGWQEKQRRPEGRL
jgi:predicted nucleic acid-binding protein